MVQSRATGSRDRSLERCYIQCRWYPQGSILSIMEADCRNANVEAGRPCFSPDLAVRFEFSVRDPIHVGHHGISKHPVRHISWTCVPSPHPCLVPAHTLHTPFTPTTAQGRDRHSDIICIRSISRQGWGSLLHFAAVLLVLLYPLGTLRTHTLLIFL